jgi:hypothetical protein
VISISSGSPGGATDQIMTTFTQLDQEYRNAIEAPGRELGAAFIAARKVEQIDLSGIDLTHAVLLRLKSFLLTQEKIKRSLNKVYAAPAADFFVETVCFFLQVVLEKLDPSLSVASEKNIVRRQGSMRPDISVWRGDTIIAVIECKTQLGWNRDGWQQDFEAREKRLKNEFVNARLFLLVMTGSNWGGFGDDHRVGKQFFVLLDQIWPNHFEVSDSGNKSLVHPIESLFNEIYVHANGELPFQLDRT